MDIDYYEDGSHSGSGLGTSSNGPVPTPGPVGQAAYDIATSAGDPIESVTRIDGLADSGFDDQGAGSSDLGEPHSAPNPDSVGQPTTGQSSPNQTSYPS